MRRTPHKRSAYNLRLLIERAIADECGLPRAGLWYCVNHVETSGHPIERIIVWSTLHFTKEGSPFCCGEPICHLGLLGERLERVNEHLRRALGLIQSVTLDFVGKIGVQYHQDMEFKI